MLQEELDVSWAHYGKTVQSLADTEWNERVKPYLQENLIAFSQANGSWWMTKDGEDFYSSDFHPTEIKYKFEKNHGYPPILQDEAGQQILDILSSLVGGQCLMEIGNYMPLYDPTKEKQVMNKFSDLKDKVLKSVENVDDDKPWPTAVYD